MTGRGAETVDVRPKDVLVMKKDHPCGGRQMLVLRSGMDFKLRCLTCGHEFMVPRGKIERNIRQVLRQDDEP